MSLGASRRSDSISLDATGIKCAGENGQLWRGASCDWNRHSFYGSLVIVELPRVLFL